MHAATAMSRTELHDAVEDGDVEGVRLLLEKSTDQINTRDFQGRTPAYLASWRGKNDILSILILEGADINIGKNNGATPAFIAASEGFNETLRLLVSNGADVNRTKTNIEKDSPATVAALNGNIDCLRTLVQGEADMEYSNSFGKSPAIYLEERHGQDLSKIMLEERRKKATQQLRQSIRFNDAEEIKKRVSEARKYEVSESKLNMLGWQSALHKALTDKKSASTSRNNAVLKVVWQWRAHCQALKMQKVRDQRRKQAVMIVYVALAHSIKRTLAMALEQWRRGSMLLLVGETARKHRGQQKRLRTALLRLNRKYAATAMLRCLENFFVRRMLVHSFSHWRADIVFQGTLVDLKKKSARIIVRILGRRACTSLLFQAWSRLQVAVRESKQHAARVADRQIVLFRKKVERNRRRAAILTVFFFGQRCARAYLNQWFTHWRYVHRLLGMKASHIKYSLQKLEVLRTRILVTDGWHQWHGFFITLKTKRAALYSQHRALHILDRVAKRLILRRTARTLRFWRLRRTLPQRRLDQRSQALLRLHLIIQRHLRIRTWSRLRQHTDKCATLFIQKKQSELVAEREKKALVRTQRMAAAYLSSKSRMLHTSFLRSQLKKWRVITKHQGSLLGDIGRVAPRMLFLGVERVYKRVMRRALNIWCSAVQRINNNASKSSMSKLQKKLTQTQHLLQETNRMVGGAMMRSVLLNLGLRMQRKMLFRWRGVIKDEKILKMQNRKFGLHILELTLRRRTAIRKSNSLRQWRQATVARRLEVEKDEAIASLYKDIGTAAKLRERAFAMQSALRTILKTNVRVGFAIWKRRSDNVTCKLKAASRILRTINHAACRRVAAAKGGAASGAARASSMRHGGITTAWFLWRHLVNTQKLTSKLQRLERRKHAIMSLGKVFRILDMNHLRTSFGMWRWTATHRAELMMRSQLSHITAIESLLKSRLRSTLTRRFIHWAAHTTIYRLQSTWTASTQNLKAQVVKDQHKTILLKLATFVDKCRPQVRWFWNQWRQMSHLEAQTHTLRRQRAILTMNSILRESLIKTQGIALVRWRVFIARDAGREATLAAVTKHEARLAHEEWRLSVTDTLKRYERIWQTKWQQAGFVRWQKCVLREKLGYQINNQRYLAVQKLQKVIEQNQQLKVHTAWTKWQSLTRGAKGDEAARKLKNKFKRIKRDLRKASRAQGLGMLNSVASRFSAEVKGFAFHYWAQVFVVHPRERHRQQKCVTLACIAATHKVVYGVRAQTRAAWGQWSRNMFTARLIETEKRCAEKIAVSNEKGRLIQKSSALRQISFIITRAFMRRVRRSFDLWIDVLDEETNRCKDEQTTREIVQKDEALLAVNVQMVTLQARVQEELLPKIESLNTYIAERQIQVKDQFKKAMKKQQEQAVEIMRNALQNMEAMKPIAFSPPPPPLSSKKNKNINSVPEPREHEKHVEHRQPGNLMSSRKKRDVPPPPPRKAFGMTRQDDHSIKSAAQTVISSFTINTSTRQRPDTSPSTKVSGPRSPSSMKHPFSLS